MVFTVFYIVLYGFHWFLHRFAWFLSQFFTENITTKYKKQIIVLYFCLETFFRTFFWTILSSHFLTHFFEPSFFTHFFEPFFLNPFFETIFCWNHLFLPVFFFFAKLEARFRDPDLDLDSGLFSRFQIRSPDPDLDPRATKGPRTLFAFALAPGHCAGYLHY